MKRSNRPSRGGVPGLLPFSVVFLPLFRHGLYHAARAARSARGVRARTCAAVLPYDPASGRGRADPPSSGRAPMSPDAIPGRGSRRRDHRKHDESPNSSSGAKPSKRRARDKEVSPFRRCGEPRACSETCACFLGRVDTANAGGAFGARSRRREHPGQVSAFANARHAGRDEIGKRVGVIPCRGWPRHRAGCGRGWR